VLEAGRAVRGSSVCYKKSCVSSWLRSIRYAVCAIKKRSCVSSWLRSTRYTVCDIKEEVLLVAGYAIRGTHCVI